MDNSNIPTHANLRVHVPMGLIEGTRDIELNDIQAVRVRHRDNNNRNSDHTIFIKNAEPERVEIGAAITAKPWKGFDGHHTVDMMKKAGADDIVAIPETNYRHKGGIYNSRTLYIRSSAIESVMANPAAPDSESLIVRVGGGKPIRVVAPVREVTSNPALARFKPQEAQPA